VQITLGMKVPMPLTQKEATRIARLVAPLPNPAVVELVHDLFGNEYMPGTFMLAERKNRPAFLVDDWKGGYESWIKAMTRSHLIALSRACFLPSPPDKELLTAAGDAVLTVLDAPLETGATLCECITNQQATDVVWRILKVLLTVKGDPYAPIHVFQSFNKRGHDVAMLILSRQEVVDPEQAFKRAIVAGALGVDIKAIYTAAGPSPLIDHAIIRLSGVDGRKLPVEAVQAELDARADEDLAIDCFRDFRREVLHKVGPVALLFFTDDYIETIFDLAAIQTWLLSKRDLKVTIVPKWGQHANDASFDDVQSLLQEPLFKQLNELQGSRFFILPHGPAGSGINAYELSLNVLKELASADIVLFKGARSYEMLQGVRKVSYFAFNVLHSFTETLTGLDATECPRVLIRQDPGVPSFTDFKARAYRKKTFRSGRTIGVARMTAYEYVAAVSSPRYAQIVNAKGDRDAANNAILAEARASGKTFAQVVFGASMGCVP